ncbi:unnamed protein product (macronuclear) [Paramecium tetraurelia]|uniref:Potassium channel domain-containing protein n=1 Tax=Paramecium tetraurelia TaxID=5888 RepID=A0DKJ4_PARTE|nr:uncharacterized protein GSPATT00017891001 [Paramecium tetraurelia]CAK83561.1 unnamed protein product [Paramecium tetraurelia]|eukprot:XP_001450958.1 hypothetical protein (macronuclear) [Paramecium tetraurelia strain d4-2]
MNQIEKMLIYLFGFDSSQIEGLQINKKFEHNIIQVLYQNAIASITIYFFTEMILLIQLLKFPLNSKKPLIDMEKYLSFNHILLNLSQFIFLFFTLLILWHAFGIVIILFLLIHSILQYYVGNIRQSSFSNSWIQQQNLQHSALFPKYGYQFQWETATMVTLGYGDVTPYNIYEDICAIIMIFFAIVVFAFQINAIAIIFSNIDLQKQSQKRNLLLVNQYMDKNEASLQLQS